MKTRRIYFTDPATGETTEALLVVPGGEASEAVFPLRNVAVAQKLRLERLSFTFSLPSSSFLLITFEGSLINWVVIDSVGFCDMTVVADRDFFLVSFSVPMRVRIMRRGVVDLLLTFKLASVRYSFVTRSVSCTIQEGSSTGLAQASAFVSSQVVSAVEDALMTAIKSTAMGHSGYSILKDPDLPYTLEQTIAAFLNSSQLPPEPEPFTGLLDGSKHDSDFFSTGWDLLAASFERLLDDIQEVPRNILLSGRPVRTYSAIGKELSRVVLKRIDASFSSLDILALPQGSRNHLLLSPANLDFEIDLSVGLPTLLALHASLNQDLGKSWSSGVGRKLGFRGLSVVSPIALIYDDVHIADINRVSLDATGNVKIGSFALTKSGRSLVSVMGVPLIPAEKSLKLLAVSALLAAPAATMFSNDPLNFINNQAAKFIQFADEATEPSFIEQEVASRGAKEVQNRIEGEVEVLLNTVLERSSGLTLRQLIGP
jgi:hypothetical protein